jgi:tetratricopeptide (TPR) repeat protein
MATDEPRRARRLAYWGVIAAVPLLVLAALELAVRGLLGDEAPLDRYLTFTDRPRFFDVVEIDGRLHHRVAHAQAYRGRNVVFPVEKPPGTRRIFVLGGSAAAGWPHPDDQIWTLDLERALERAFPDTRFEVLNIGAHAYPSYRVRLILESVLDFDPDAVVIYSGNNEFLESRSYLRGSRALAALESAANRLAIYRRLRSAFIRARFPGNALPGAESADVGLNVWTKLARASLALREDPEQFERVKLHYADTIDAMVREAGRRGVPALLATVPVNLRDWVPNVSVRPPEGAAGERWAEALRGGRRALLEGDAREAVVRLERAVEAAPRHAETWFRLGQALEAAGRFEASIDAFQQAVDLDHNPFRAISAFNDGVRAIAAARPGVALADLEAAFRAASAPRAPGFDLFLDYVHPNLEGGRVAARTVFDALRAAGVVSASGPTEFSPEPDPGARAYDEDLDDELQETLFWLFGMMHQYEAMVSKAEHLGARGSQVPLLRPVLRVFRDHLYAERRELMGQPVGAEERARIDERVAGFYRHTYHFEP